MFIFPDEIIIKIDDANTEKPVSSIAVCLTIFASRKNDHTMIPKLSDQSGKIFISKQWIIEQIDEHFQYSVMDYASSLEQCKSKIGIKVLSEDDIIKMNEGRKIWGIYPPVVGTANHQYESLYREVDLVANQNPAYITLTVSKKQHIKGAGY